MLNTFHEKSDHVILGGCILNTFLKKDCTKQLSSKNLTHLASSILEKDRGKIDLPDGVEIVWNKDYINLEKN